MAGNQDQVSLMGDLLPTINYAGYLISFDTPQHREDFGTLARDGKPYIGALRIKDLPSGEFGMCLISTDGKTITYASLIRKLRAEVTFGPRFEFSEYVDIRPVSFKKLVRVAKVEIGGRIASAAGQRGTAVPKDEWRQLLDALVKISPTSAKGLSALEQHCRELQRQAWEDAFEVMMMERDAIGLALEFADLDRPRFLSQDLPLRTQKPMPALACMKNVQIIEEDLIARDMKVFGGWIRHDRLESKSNVVQFENDSSTLTVLNANRNDIERTTGVDLVYFHDRYNSFVMVQYKRMRREGKKKKSLVYRFNDKSYERQFELMKQLRDHTLLNQECKHMDQYRLHGEAFYFKLCDPGDETISKRDLIPGCYFPLNYWEFLEASEFATGDREGKVIHQSRVRYLNNTLFVKLVQDGWIGSNSRSIVDLDEIVEESLKNGRSVMYARRTPKVKRR